MPQLLWMWDIPEHFFSLCKFRMVQGVCCFVMHFGCFCCFCFSTFSCILYLVGTHWFLSSKTVGKSKNTPDESKWSFWKRNSNKFSSSQRRRGRGGEMKDDSKKSKLCFHFTVTILVTKPNCRRTCVRERKKTPKCKQVSHALEEAMQAVWKSKNIAADSNWSFWKIDFCSHRKTSASLKKFSSSQRRRGSGGRRKRWQQKRKFCFHFEDTFWWPSRIEDELVFRKEKKTPKCEQISHLMLLKKRGRLWKNPRTQQLTAIEVSGKLIFVRTEKHQQVWKSSHPHNGEGGGEREKMTAKKFVEEFEDFCRS